MKQFCDLPTQGLAFFRRHPPQFPPQENLRGGEPVAKFEVPQHALQIGRYRVPSTHLIEGVQRGLAKATGFCHNSAPHLIIRV